jgi:hypothetical protein
MNKQIPVFLAVALIALFSIGAFYGGFVYGKKSMPASQSFRPGQMGGNQPGQRTVQRAGGNFLTGEILKLDDFSITVKLNDGGSKTAYLTGSTTIDKLTAGKVEDLVVGAKVMVGGKTNSDGSLNAETIQLRHALPDFGQRPEQVQK